MMRIRPYKNPYSGRLIAPFILLITLCSMLAGQDYKVKQFGVSQGLPQDYVYSIHQDASGYLWIGTGDGLARFNGISFEIFTEADSLCSNFISCSHTDGLNSWFGHNDGGISYFDGIGFSKVVAGEQDAGSITEIKLMGDIIWASTQSGGIWRIGPDHEAMLLKDPDHPLQIFSMEFLSSTELAVGSLDGVHILSLVNESNKLEFVSTLEGIPETRIQDLMMSRDESTLYIITEDDGIYFFDPDKPNSLPSALGIVLKAGIEGQQQILEDSKGALWISTFGNGLYKLIPDSEGRFTTWLNYNESNGLPGDNLKVVFEDREENTWLGMYGEGLIRLVDAAYTFYSFEENELMNDIHSIYATEESLLFGSGSGLIRFDKSTGDYKLVSGTEYGLPDDRITAIVGSPLGELWIGTSQNGVYHLNPGEDRFAGVPISTGTLENSINALAYEASLLWISTDKGVCRIDQPGGEPIWFTISNAGLPHNTIDNLQMDDSGTAWLSTISTTLSYIQDDTVSRLDIPTIGSALSIRSIIRGPEGQLWIGTYGNGVYKLDGDSAINYTTENGLLSNFCNALVSDDINYIWVSHRGGLSRIRISDGQVSQVQEEAGIVQSMDFNQNAVFKDQEGIIWFGSNYGVLVYNPGLEKQHTPPPALSLVSVLINNTSHQVEDEIKLPPGRHTIRIEFIGINLENPRGVTYSYSMDGLGESWSRSSTENHVTFTKLPYGNYTFKLRAYDSNGNSNINPLELRIQISKPLWKRWWIQLLSLIAFSTGILAIIKRREFTLKLEKQKLEKTVNERTQEVVDQKEEIEHQRDALQIQSEKITRINQNITDSIVYASYIQKAIFPPAESLTGVFPESFIMSRPKYIVSGDFFWMANQKEKHVFTVADCTGHGVPGALMSMLGITLLDKIVNNQKCIDAAKILNQMKDGIINALRQTLDSNTTSDGMDMALCVFDPVTNKLQYSGGFIPLVLIRDGELKSLKADPMPVGIGGITSKKFTNQELELQKGDQIFLYSDGYEDQFGGEENVKFSRQKLRELLLETSTLPVKDQKVHLENRMNEWISGHEQIDDMMIVGIRF